MGGRPTKYKPEYDQQAHKLALLGATDLEMANFFEIAESTLHLWKKEHLSFSESLKGAKDIADAEVAKSLFERALGYEHDSEEIKVIDGVVVRIPTKKKYPPDTAALTMWLKNRQPDKWRDKVDINHGGQKDNPIVTSRADQDIINEYLTKKEKDNA